MGGRHAIHDDAIRSMLSFLEQFLPGRSASMQRLREDITRLNEPINLALVRTVLIVGESGAGKTYVAKVLAAHREFMQAGEDAFQENANLDSYLLHFDDIHLPNLPEELIESELFGHRKGSFTGAIRDKLGLLSSEGEIPKTDILLDEIGDASAKLQAKLLQVVESGRFRQVGAEPGDEDETAARLIFATNRLLEQDVRDGRFRADLYWRLNAARIEVPPLRGQLEQIELLLAHILGTLLATISERVETPSPLPRFGVEDIAWARSYGWPGNVRQLRSLVQRWLSHGGRKPLRDLISSGEIEQLHRESGTIESATVARLKSGDVLNSLSALLDEAERRTKREILDWYKRASPSASELERRFPGMKVRSIRQKLSDWRRELGDD